MRWRSFLEEAFPEANVRAEQEQNIVFRGNRWLGLRAAYVLYHLGVSANLLSVARLVLAFGGLFLVSRVAVGAVWIPLVGAAVLAIQIHLDFADGPIARMRGQLSELGEKLDGLPNAALRAVALMLAGFLTENGGVFLASAFAAYVLVVFVPESNLQFRTVGIWKTVLWLYRVLLYVPVMAFVLPLAMGLHGILGRDVRAFSIIAVFVYGSLAVVWLLLLLWKTERPASPFERT